MTMTKQDVMRWDEQHPTSIRIEKVFGGGLALATIYVAMASVFMAAFGGAGPLGHLFLWMFLFWTGYGAYRLGKRFSVEFRTDGRSITVNRTSSVYSFIKSQEAYVLGRDTIVELVPSKGWWIPKDILTMEGDDVQWFSDLAIKTEGEDGRVRRILISRDRATLDVMMQRRERIEAMLEGTVARVTG